MTSCCLANRAKKLLGSEKVSLSTTRPQHLDDGIARMRTFTDYAPWWVLLMVASRWPGHHDRLAAHREDHWRAHRQGAPHLRAGRLSELVAAAMIGVSTQFGLPASTTHVLTSSIAGSMVASRGVKNLNPRMVRNIALAWVLTLPVTMVLSGAVSAVPRHAWLSKPAQSKHKKGAPGQPFCIPDLANELATKMGKCRG